ncbi:MULTISPECIES: nucleotide exchange factor GrpE [Psychrobacter]|jgi:molecular chaperone GrpE|uniref:Protein GrpE n=2 Tax=Psychrobacter TaxID=497 RepID=A0A844M0Q3_9GAMM|nr:MULTISPECIES: nucleotide exchange factor GrpE [Psychrobacter]MUG32522.1 nucleotide exchange factor GrpE [Psychrobacter sanguinis]UNK05383.1 nucleotide exchange factor GrpE [Psychrobacter sp. PraFG1]
MSNNEANNPQDNPVHDNVGHSETILEETLNEFNPEANGGDNDVVHSDIDVSTYQARIAELEGEVKAAKEGQARANADAYNAQKRMEQETEKSRKFALQKFAKELLEVVDNLERAIVSVQADDDADDAILEGVKLTHKSFLNVLNKQGVEVVDPQNAKFDPELHEAVGIDPEAPADTVGDVLQKGYTLNGRLLRPAMVKVGQ